MKTRIAFAFSLFALAVFPLAALEMEQDAVIYSISSGYASCDDSKLPDIVSSFFDEDLYRLESELRKEFTFSWAEDNLAAETKTMLAKTLSPLLGDLLPCDDVVFSRAVILEDGSKSFRFKDMNKGNVYSVVCKEGKIVSMSLI